MSVVLWILAVIILLIILVLFTVVKVTIIYKRELGNDHLAIQIKALFGLFRYKKIIPFLKAKSDGSGVEMSQKTQTGLNNDTTSEKKKTITEEDSLKNLSDVKKIVEHVFNLKKIVLKLLKRVHVKEFLWESVIGTGDAASTGVVTGAGWAIKGSIIGIISNFMSLVVYPIIVITPDFHRAITNTHLKCMIQVRVGHAILAGIQLLKYWRGNIPKFKSKALGKVNDLKN